MTIPVIKLCRGAGNGKNTACLATAVAMLNGEGHMRDNPSCLCPIIRSFVIPTNDALSDDLRAEFYGDLPWHLIGTRINPAADVDDAAHAAARAAARAALHAVANAASVYANHADAAHAAAHDAAHAAAHAAHDDAHAAAAVRARIAAEAAADFASMAKVRAGKRAIAARCRQCILDMAAVGSRTPIEPAYTPSELSKVLV